MVASANPVILNPSSWRWEWSKWELQLILAVQKFEVNAVRRTICGKLYRGLNITVTESLQVNPNPLTCYKTRWLAVSKRLAMVKCESLIVGQSHGDRLGLLGGQRCTRSGAGATDEKQRENDNERGFHKSRHCRLTFFN
jgi:hypothetical protein